MKLKLIGVILALSFFSTPSYSTEYIYRDLMANTPPSARCEAQANAEETAQKNLQNETLFKKVLPNTRLRLGA
jgi:hypothetical protein